MRGKELSSSVSGCSREKKTRWTQWFYPVILKFTNTNLGLVHVNARCPGHIRENSHCIWNGCPLDKWECPLFGCVVSIRSHDPWRDVLGDPSSQESHQALGDQGTLWGLKYTGMTSKWNFSPAGHSGNKETAIYKGRSFTCRSTWTRFAFCSRCAIKPSISIFSWHAQWSNHTWLKS